jgi:ribose transport system permease protein
MAQENRSSQTPVSTTAHSTPAVAGLDYAPNVGPGELVSGRTIGLVISTAILFAILAIRSDSFLSLYTMAILARQIAFFVIIALAQAMCLVVGGMNLSVGAIGGFTTVILGLCIDKGHMPGFLAVPIALLVGSAAGFLNGTLITRLKIDSFIVTLSMMFVFMGLRSGISDGAPYRLPNSFSYIGQSLGVPYVFLITLLVLAAVSYIFANTVFGRRLLATGGNPDAARLSGINTDRMIVHANVLSGFFAALAAVLWASMLSSAAPETGNDWLIISFAVAIIGGTGLTGGVVSGLGILMGAAIYMLIRHGLVELKTNDYYANSFVGALILLAIILDRAREVYAKRSTPPA